MKVKINSVSVLFFLIILNCFSGSALFARSKLVKALSEGKEQYVVVYGTSLSSGGHGKVWMQEVADYFNDKYGNHLKYSLSGRGGMWSTWGVQHLEDSVISKNPDAVIIEFGINDAFEKYKTPPLLARLNLEYMIERIKIQNPSCEIILQVMNMAIGKSDSARPNLTAYYDVYRKIAKEKKLLLIDHYPNWQKILNQGEAIFLSYVPDGLHPGDESGKNIIAPFIIDCLEGNHVVKPRKH